MNRTEKLELALSLKEKFSKAKVSFFADYKGLSASAADQLRKNMRLEETEVRVLKNNVARLIIKQSPSQSLSGGELNNVLDDLSGPTLVAWAYGDPASSAKAIHRFAQDNEAFNLKDGLMGSLRLDAAAIETLAKLPAREVLLASLLGTLNAPIQNYVRVLAAVPRALVNVLAAIEKKKAEQES